MDLGGLEWSAPGSRRRRAGRRKRHILRIARRFLFLAMAAGLVFAMAAGGLMMVVPSVGDAPALARALDRAHHVRYPGPAVPERFSAALVASLDRTLYTEAEPVQMSGVFLGGMVHPSGTSAQTLYQRLASVLYLHGKAGVTSGIEESVLGIKLELGYSRAEVLRMYAAVTYFGRGHFGLKSASCGYFGEPPARLSWAQAALLAAAAAAPAADDPYTRAARARAVSVIILRRLAASGVLSPAQARRAYRQPLGLLRLPDPRKPGHRHRHHRRRHRAMPRPRC